MRACDAFLSFVSCPRANSSVRGIVDGRMVYLLVANQDHLFILLGLLFLIVGAVILELILEDRAVSNAQNVVEPEEVQRLQ